MKQYSEEEIGSLIERFEVCRLPKVEWTHEAHLVVAIHYCSKFPIHKALPLVRERIVAHNTSVGTPNTDMEGYHETITRFWLLVAEAFLRERAPAALADMANAFIVSRRGQSSYPLEFYSATCLFSTKARRGWVEPDRKELSVEPRDDLSML